MNKFTLMILCSIGGGLEFYDFVIFAIYAKTIGLIFFPDKSSELEMIYSFAVFATGYLIRPLGGIIFSHFGDKYARKKTFMMSIAIMGIATTGIAILPGYNQIGILAPIGLILFRIIQGLAIGGEIPGAITFISEHLPKRSGLGCGCLFLFINIGIIVAESMHTILSGFKASLSWRLAFAIGGILAIFSYFLRRKIHESEIFNKEKIQHKIPLFTLFKKERKNTILGTLIVGSHAAIISIFFLYITSYLELLHYDNDTINFLTLNCTIILTIFCLIGGVIADFVPKKLLMLFGLITIIPLGLWLFTNISTRDNIMLSYILVAIVSGTLIATINSFLASLFPTDIRFSGIAVCYNIAFAIFGGLSPLLCSILIKASGNNLAPAFMLSVVFLTSIIAIFFTKEKVLNTEYSIAKRI